MKPYPSRSVLWGFAIAAIGSAIVAAQNVDRPKFEVASVRPNSSDDNRISIGVQPGGRFSAVNVPLRLLIRNAYRLQDFQIIGPDWIANEHFDIIAKAEGEFPPPSPGGAIGPVQLMLQSLFEERFKLVAHRETRELPIYALVAARNDGKFGPQLRPSSTDCATLAAERGRGGPPPAPPGPGERPRCGMMMAPGRVSAGGVPISQLATVLSPSVQRVVVDRSGLTGNFDFDLIWTPDQLPQGPPPPGVQLPSIDPNGPSIFTAVQEQLGLKLDSQRGPVEVLVIDHVERPIPD